MKKISRSSTLNYLTTLVVGDDPDGDLRMPIEIDMLTTYVDSGKVEHWPDDPALPDVVVSNPKELKQYLIQSGAF